MQHFAAEKFKATFPIFNKVDVNGANTHPVFKFLKDHTPLGHGEGRASTGGTLVTEQLYCLYQKVQAAPTLLSAAQVGAVSLEMEDH